MKCSFCGTDKPDVELRPDPRPMESMAMIDMKPICEMCYLDAEIPYQSPELWHHDNKDRMDRIKAKKAKKTK